MRGAGTEMDPAEFLFEIKSILLGLRGTFGFAEVVGGIDLLGEAATMTVQVPDMGTFNLIVEKTP